MKSPRPSRLSIFFKKPPTTKPLHPHRYFASPTTAKKEGDISSVFPSLSGSTPTVLPERFAQLKRQLLCGHEDKIVTSWNKLLDALALENEEIAAKSSAVIPQIEYKDLENEKGRKEFEDKVRKRGVAVIHSVVPEEEARGYKDEIEEYIRKNPGTKAFPPNDPQVFELYWSAPQLKARAHPNLLSTQKALMSIWNSPSSSSEISTQNPLTYADRLRIRQPGDSGFALGPHIDGGSVERWEPSGYGLGGSGAGVYTSILSGNWQDYDPWNAGNRIGAMSDLYNGAGACSMFRMFQGWLSMSTTAPKEGTLLVNPLLKLAMSYLLLRPFFEAVRGRNELGGKEYLGKRNWNLSEAVTSELQGARPGASQELNDELHPHLELERTMVHVPKIRPGDYVVWHCDTIHAVDKIHTGNSDSSVMYIPVCPTTEHNLRYLADQRDTFERGVPAPDFPGGNGESEHVGRPDISYLREYASEVGLKALGF